VKHWAWALRRKAEIEGEPEPVARRDTNPWNEDVELNCFKIRLNLDVNISTLKTVFAADPSNQPKSPESRSELIHSGESFAKAFIENYVDVLLSKAPEDCKIAVVKYLMDASNLAFIASNLAYGDMINSPIYPVPNELLVDSFYASVGAIIMCKDSMVAGEFLLDFVVPQLVGKDILHDLWNPKDPMSILVKELKLRSMQEPEARLVAQSGINTVLPVYIVALYSDRKFLAKSGGESIIRAETDAARIVLRKLYDIEEVGKTPIVRKLITSKFLSELFAPFKNDDEVLKA